MTRATSPPPPRDRQASSTVRRALTLADVARALGVSRTTVSNAFNRPGQLSATLRADILRRSRELGYFGPDATAQALRRRGLREVAVVFHHDLLFAMSDPTSVAFLRGVAGELDKRQLTLQLIPKLGRKVELSAAFRTTADALIVHAEIAGSLVEELLAIRSPAVLVDSWVAEVPTVCIADRQGAAMAMKHALSAAPDRVLVLGFPLNEADRERVLKLDEPPHSAFVAGERMAGYVRAARAGGFPLDRILWRDVDDRYPESAAECVALLRRQLAPRTRLAIVAMSDRIALAAQQVIKTWRGVKVVALVGCDDIPAAAAAGLTTLRQDARLKGELAVRILLDDAKPTVLPVELIVRQT
jgi:DNA-binding LacI/PurR family transcriptional regulator